MALFKSIITLILLTSTAYAQSPEWVKNFGRSTKYPAHLYLTGFGLAQLGKDLNLSECKQLATDDAKSTLIQNIRVTIRSEVTSKVKEVNEKVSEYFSSVTQSNSTIEINGLELEHYFGKNACYSLAIVSRDKLTRIYAKQASKLRDEIKNNVEIAKGFEEAGQPTEALNKYLACYPLFRKLEESQLILTVSQSNYANTVDELDMNINSDQFNIERVNNSVQKLIQRPILTTDDLAWHLVFSMNRQMNEPDGKLLVIPFSYRDTKMGSQYARYFKQQLDSKVVELTSWNIVQQAANVAPRTRNIAREFAVASGAALVLTGTYWEQPDGVKFLATLRRVSDSRIVASAEALISFSALEKSQLDIKPQNFSNALSDQKIFNKDEVIGGGLNLEVWTNKGIDNVLYTKGETMQAYVRVNMPSYIRFIYHLADGERTLLLDNYYIDESKVNMVYQIPEEFECAAPFGAEFLQAFARTERFEPLKTTDIDGYDIIDENLSEFIPRMRGFKKFNKEVQQAENMVVITTLK